MFQRFEDSFTLIETKNLKEHFVELHRAVNDMIVLSVKRMYIVLRSFIRY